ncbi:MAG: pirin family protein [Ignavibacteriae bacterium]|nr:pirin family protein [Ignavibacteriota bacterium]
MQTTIHKANTRGGADHGWLKAKHTFSFASYMDPSRVHFGVLRVLNDDIIAGGGGFPTHPHDNMEIVTIPIIGALAHRDSTGGNGTISAGEVQIMSAGTGIRHSEFNASEDETVNLLQIWLFPKLRNIQPRYDQRAFTPEERKNTLRVVVSPEEKDNALWINQDAYFALGNLDKGVEVKWDIRNEGSGVYLFVIEGEIDANGIKIERRDGMGITETNEITIRATDESIVLLMELPMR